MASSNVRDRTIVSYRDTLSSAGRVAVDATGGDVVVDMVPPLAVLVIC
jgi:hypothetical protein